MKLLTINVHAWLEERQDEKLDVLAQTIAEKAYDVIALQEVNQLITADLVTKDLKADNYGLILLEKLRALGQFDYSYYWSNSHIGYDKYEEGIAFLTKLPVYEVDPFYCSQNKSVDSILSRKIMGLTVFYQDQLIDLYSCHINLPGVKRKTSLITFVRLWNGLAIDVLRFSWEILIPMPSQIERPTKRLQSSGFMIHTI